MKLKHLIDPVAVDMDTLLRHVKKKLIEMGN